MAVQDKKFGRRAFLGATVGAGAALALGPLAGCGDDEGNTTPDPDTADTGLNNDVETDAPTDDTGVDVAPDGTLDATEDVDAPLDTDTEVDATPVAASQIVKGPWLQLTAQGEARLRLETFEGVTATVTLFGPDDAPMPIDVETSTTEVTFRWPRVALNIDAPDEAGRYTVHDAIFAALEGGASYRWLVETSADGVAGVPVEGTFVGAAASGAAFRMAWISDTMYPTASDVIAQLAPESPDLVIHGGDLQYQSNPVDTWNGMFEAFAPLMRQAPIHFTIGNHEYEDHGEYEELWVRLLGDQGYAGGAHTYHRFDFNGVRFLVLNSEEEFGADGPQMDWLRAELETAAQDDTLTQVIPVFHRPFFTFSRARPNFDRRAYVHGLFVQFGIKLVMTGHNHCYERFLVDGITYTMDGGGGASSYNPDHNLYFFEEERPDELSQRVVAARPMGGLVLDFAADGSVAARRRNVFGEQDDTFEVAPWVAPA